MPQPARRLEVFTESVIREMTRLSNRHGSINLAQGFPDFRDAQAAGCRVVRCVRAVLALDQQVEAALAETGLVYQGFQREDVVGGAVVRAEASLKG